MNAAPDAALAAEHSTLLTFVNAAPIGMVQLAPDGSVKLMNALAAQLLLPLVPDRNLDNLYAALRPHAPQLQQQALAFTAAHGMVCRDMPLQLGGPLSTAPAGAPYTPQFLSLTLMKLSPKCVMALLSDITRQVLTERALHATERRLRLALNALHVGEWELDLQTATVLRSAQLDRLFGREGEPIAWTLDTFLRHVHVQDLDRVAHSFQAAVSALQEWRVEFRVFWADGSVHWLAAHGHVDAVEGTALRLFALLVDTTEERAADDERARAHALELENIQVRETSRLKSQFLSNMSHELRTPLNAIIGFAELLQRGTVGVGSPKYPQFLQHISNSGHHLLQIINDVLDMAKVEAGRFEFAPEAVSPRSLVDEVVGVLHAASLAKQQQVQSEIDPELGELHIDPVRLKQVLFNFLSNAIKFTPAGGHITVRLAAQGQQHFRVEVEDDGIGVKPADIGRLFVEFNQLDASINRSHVGTGLGLALTKRLVEAQGGQVGVHSTPGVATVFHAVLNRSHGWDARHAGAADEASARDQRMLVIERDPMQSGPLVAGLLADGLQVDAVSTGAAAQNQVAATAYGAITLDMVLPDETGLNTLGHIRDEGASRDAPVVGLSMPAADGSAARFAIANVLCKPIRGDEVVTAMERLRLPSGRPARVLVVDDDPLAIDLMCVTLSNHGMQGIPVHDSRRTLDELDLHRPDALILELAMNALDGFTVLNALRHTPAWRDLPVFIWTSMALSAEEHARLARSARIIVGKGGGGLSAMLDDLQRWRTQLRVAAQSGRAP
jgi:signal transduction histidine kinase/DNA-binding response OmpR family regulator